ncbi:MAG: tetratricopeptide repeat protein [Rhodanobacteraceae bacterium]|nr:tetratricopeptide repeat protein [Rhodanobacteraceae bacterium]
MPGAVTSPEGRDPRTHGLSANAVDQLRLAADAVRTDTIDAARHALDGVFAEAPAHPEALRLLALVQLRQQRPADAISSLRRALSAWPNDGLLRSDLGNAQAATGDIDAATASWQRATELAPDHAMPWFNLGRQQQLRGDSGTAAASLGRALDVAPDLVPAQILRGDALVHLGHFDEAVRHYRAALAQHPACGDAWRGLANIKTRSLDDADRTRMRALLQLPETADNDRIAIGFALGKADEDAGEYRAALDALQVANELQRRRSPWNEQALRGYVDQVLAATRQLPKPPIGVLRAMLPGAHIIDMRRDPLETAWSCYKQQFYQLPHFACDFADIAAYLHHCERALDVWRHADTQHIHLQRYEALVAEPEPELRRLFVACNIEFAPTCLDYAQSARSVRTASAAQVREPLRADTARAARYGDLLDPLRDELVRWPSRRDNP